MLVVLMPETPLKHEQALRELTTAGERYEYWRARQMLVSNIASWDMLGNLYRVPWYELAKMHIKMTALEYRLEKAEKQLELDSTAQGSNDS